MKTAPSSDLVTPQQVAADIAREYRANHCLWTQKVLGRDSDGVNTYDATDPRAVCWCLRGAIDRRLPTGSFAAQRVYEAFDRAIGREWAPDDDAVYFVDWNDSPGRTVEEVIELCEQVAAS